MQALNISILSTCHDVFTVLNVYRSVTVWEKDKAQCVGKGEGGTDIDASRRLRLSVLYAEWFKSCKGDMHGDVAESAYLVLVDYVCIELSIKTTVQLLRLHPVSNIHMSEVGRLRHHTACRCLPGTRSAGNQYVRTLSCGCICHYIRLGVAARSDSGSEFSVCSAARQLTDGASKKCQHIWFYCERLKYFSFGNQALQ